MQSFSHVLYLILISAILTFVDMLTLYFLQLRNVQFIEKIGCY
jgi:hypothetical protein